MNLYIVTGASKGLGAALAAALAGEAGSLVIGFSRDPERNEPSINIHADFSNLAAIAPAFERAAATFAGRRFERAVLFNNAGVVEPVGRFDEIDVATLSAGLAVNLAAPMAMTRLFAHATRDIAERRLVVNISSGAARRAIAGWSAYCAAKAGLEMATRVAALEADARLAICSLAPGVVDTSMQAVIRGVDEHDFPDVARFRAMKADGALRAPVDVARDIIAVMNAGKLANGGNFDIREMKA